MFDSLATLLGYPTAPLDGACTMALAGCADRHPRAAVRLAEFTGTATQMPLAELQELYTRTFDFDADTALYVGHQLFGEDGRRGLFIAGMVERYRTLGLTVGSELADHFSPVLRSLAVDRDSEEADDLVRCGLLPAIGKILSAVEKRAPMYAAVLYATAFVLDDQAGEQCEIGSNRWRPSSSRFFLTLLS
jgi:nitrate reductase molybdenum cofactor assembly chaperone NarJ/NarW